jgi:hypothetical protein
MSEQQEPAETIKDEQQEPEQQPSETIEEWCRFENCSTTFYHSLKRRGLGPKTICIGPFVRIVETHAEWRARMAERSQQEAGRLENERRRELASRAGRAAVKSALHVCNRSRREYE